MCTLANLSQTEGLILSFEVLIEFKTSSPLLIIDKKPEDQKILYPYPDTENTLYVNMKFWSESIIS